MQKPIPYVDEEGHRYYNVRQATLIVLGVSEGTLWRWAQKGRTSFGLHLDVKLQPMAHHARSFRHDAKLHRDLRMLIPEEKVLALKEILEAAGRTRPGPWSPAEMAVLNAATARRYRNLLKPSQHPSRPPTLT